jgi:anaerobic dimethyl sulfoxide reductase subunit B (iron-sulfur subunit)
LQATKNILPAIRRKIDMQIGFYFDQSRCTGCYTCSIACKDWHDISDTSVHWRRIIPFEKGSYPDVTLAYVSLSCNHCESPACANACPAGAITKRKKNGTMVVDREQCLGKQRCEMFCRQACPYDVPQFGTEENPKMQMCTLCPDRLEGNKKPICVDACPMRALDAGPMADLREKYGDVREAEGFGYSKATNPSVIFKPRY